MIYIQRLSILIIICTIVSVGQAQSPPQWCGTDAAGMNTIKNRLLANKRLSQELVQSRSTHYVPVKFHLVAQNNGSGRVNYKNLLDQICTLNQDFSTVGIQFYIKDSFNLVNDTQINEDHYHNNNRMGPKRDTGALNVWIVKTPYSPSPDAITYGLYQISQDWLVIRRDEINRSSYTLTHEMGHFFSLLHTFYGWDIDPWTANKHGNPAPSMSPMSVPTERQDGSNCESAGDYVCDTPPDYNFGYFWYHDCDYAGGAKDPADVLVDPDETNFMAYFDRCDRSDYHFSQGQTFLMRADLMSAARGHIRTGYTPLYTQVSDNVQLLWPAAGEQTPFYNKVQLEWSVANGATHYLVEVDRVSSFSLQPFTYITTKNQLEINDLSPGRTYYWRVRPYNEYYTCAQAASPKTFKTSDIATDIKEIGHLNDWKVIPNPAKRNTGTEIAFNTSESFEAEIRLYNLTGQMVVNIGKMRFQAGNNTLPITTQNLDAGIYFLTLQTQQGRLTEKIIIQ